MKQEALTGHRIREIDNLFIQDLWNSIKKHNSHTKNGEISEFSSTVKGELPHFPDKTGAHRL